MPTHSTQSLDVAAHVAASIVPAVLDVLGQRWSLAIIQALQQQETSFCQLLAALGIPRSTLAVRLKHLQSMGCLEPAAHGYRLSAAGHALLPVVSLAQAWSGNNRVIYRHACGRDFVPVLRCAHCLEPIRARDISLEAPGEPPDLKLPKPLRRSRAEFSLPASFGAAEILGDRWTALIIALGFFGVQRYSDLARHLAIAPNILAARLQRLCEEQVLRRDGPRYHFSESGLQLFPLIVALSEWGDNWLRPPGQRPTRMVHLPCGHTLSPQLCCGGCGQPAGLESLDPTGMGVPVTEFQAGS